MKKNYLYTIALGLCLFSLKVSAQDNRPTVTGAEVLGFYPNPVNTGKIFITSKTSLDKDITIFDVLGKKVLQATINAKELSIASLSPGVYIIKIREGEATATRKLIVK
ncbi:T9SS type A sorting domain-containing protein [Flavobacterium sp. CYK-4]|uniref:T9SS type A sorting domain-containing protein n=1 Tax=Flavobacterium lotistagni TaxID=2709660 RepID=UPI00140D014B|nr:T9SS type A sorting domain-containing protein [Flavobacterium lotistagni]NHM06697.1 T9SS type A sorting domain-containing protein [Flavobacterium lotistagni]